MISSSIRNKLILFLLVATLVPFATSILITYLFTKDKVTEDTMKSNSALISQGKTNLLNYLDGVVQASLTIYTNEERYNMLQQNKIDYLSDKELTSGLQVMSHSIKEIRQIYLYAAVSDRSYLMIHENSRSTAGKYRNLQPFPDGQDIYFETTHTSTSYGIPLQTYFAPSPVLSMHRKIINFAENRVLGELVIDLNLDLIASVCSNLYLPGDEEFYILDQEGNIVFGPDASQWGTPVQEEWGKLAISSPSDHGSFEWKKGPFAGIHLYEKMKTDYLDWTIVKRLPYDQLYKNARQLTLINSLVLTLFLVIVIAGTVYISIRFTAPIKKLIRYITKIQSGQMNADNLELARTDELGILANRFHALMQDLNQMVMREYRLELANKSNQLKVLQAQINPHFLNNALQSIGTLALQHNAPRIYALISSLAKMMHYSMNTSETVVTFRKELDHVKSYLELQKQRFEHQIVIEYSIEECTYAIPVPKMILQPLVENYFKHGFKPSLGTGILRITSAKLVEHGQELLILCVEDNGVGMTEERLREVRSALLNSGTDHEAEGIGLGNVLSRIRLYFTDDADLLLQPIEPHGLKIVIKIPLQKEVNI